MTKNRTHRGRRRNRDRSVNPEDQSQVQAEGTEQSGGDVAPAQATASGSRSNPPERRRRRGRGGGQARQPQETASVPQADVSEESAATQERRPRPAGEGGGERRGRPMAEGSERRTRPAGESDDRRGRTGGDQREDGNRRPNRRRQGRRQTVQPITGEVFKPSVRPSPPAAEPISLRAEVEADEHGFPVLGCPMLTRTRLGMPFAGGRHTPRCALGWAIHSETEAGFCMATPLVSQCWKMHPERLAELTETTEDRAAD